MPGTVSILLFASFIAILIPVIDLYIKIISIILGVVLSLLLLIFFIKKIEITKDKSNNKTIIKLINFLCFPRKIIKIDRENFHFTFKSRDSNSEDSSDSIVFTIINDFKNLVDIDLDKSNIKLKPSNFYYIYNFKEIEDAVDRYTADLNNFLGISYDNYENPLYFNIDKYMNKNTDKRIYYSSFLSNYMKLYEHFFTFHIMDPLGYSCFNLKFLFFFFLFLIFVLFQHF